MIRRRGEKKKTVSVKRRKETEAVNMGIKRRTGCEERNVLEGYGRRSKIDFGKENEAVNKDVNI